LVADFSHAPEEIRERARKAKEAADAAAEIPEERVLVGYYALLGLVMGVDRHEVRKAYRKLAMEHHPDINPTPEAHRKMQEINIAYTQIIADLDRAAME
jgi:preprotein translocase subunit Sec63